MRSCGASTHWGDFRPVKIRIWQIRPASATACAGRWSWRRGPPRSGEPCVMLGPIIHNQDMMDHLARHGLRAGGQAGGGPGGERRSSSAPMGRAALSTRRLHARGVRILDATCPNVTRIHQIVARAEEQGRQAHHHRHPGPPGGAGHCGLVLPPGGPVWSGGAGRTGWRRTRPDAKCHSLLCLTDHGHPQGLGFLRRKKQKKSVQTQNFLIQYVERRQNARRRPSSWPPSATRWSSSATARAPIPGRLAELCRAVCPICPCWIERADDLESVYLCGGQRLLVSLRARPRLRG